MEEDNVSTEIHFKKISEDLEVRIVNLVRESLENIVAEYIPHVEDDKIQNVGYRLNDVLRKLCIGDYRTLEDNEGFLIVRVNDGVDIRVMAEKWKSAAKHLLTFNRNEIENVRIKELELQVERLKGYLSKIPF